MLAQMEATASDEQLESWTAQETRAMGNRDRDVKEMDVYDVQLKKGKCHHVLLLPRPLVIFLTAPGKVAIQLDLTREETNAGRRQGVAQWLANGMKIQETQYVICIERRTTR